MSLFSTLEIASSGMKAQRTRMNVSAMNMANKGTTRTAEGGPYKRRDVVLRSVDVGPGGFGDRLRAVMDRGEIQTQGVEVEEIVVSEDEAVLHYDPGHPDANVDGYVAFPNISGIKEMVNMVNAARAYEAGTTVMRTVKTLAEQALRIGR